MKTPIQNLHDLVTHNVAHVGIDKALVEQQQYEEEGEDESTAENFKKVAREAHMSPRASAKVGKKRKKQEQNKKALQPLRIWLFFDANVEWELIMDSAQQIIVKVFHQDIGQHVMMIFVYAKCGDFNAVLHKDENIGGLPMFPPEYEDFSFCINSSGLFDLGYKGSPFTWWNGRPNAKCIFKRLDRILHKLKNVKAALSKWSKVTFGDIFKQLAILEDIVKVKEMLFEEEPTIANRIVLQQAHAELKKKKLQLKRIQNGYGNWIEDQEYGVVQISNIRRGKGAVFELSGDSSSGADRFTGIFYQDYWEIIGFDIYSIILHFYGGVALSKYFTHTNLVMLPKKPMVQIFYDLRPISLSKFINKVISRVLHDRLEKLLPALISPNQSRFMKGRSIFENILLTHERVTDIRLRDKIANVMIKIDMTKAYDRVSLKYLLHVLRKMGFAEQFINMVWNLISNNWYSVLVNGQDLGFFKSTRGVKQGDPLSPVLFILSVEVNVLVNGQDLGFFKSTRGVKQGDPLSPALFILSAEVLPRSLNKLFEDKAFIGFGLPKWSEPLNHLAYVDNTIIFASAQPESLKKVMTVLGSFERISGQLINKSKSSFYMHANVSNALFQAVGNATGFTRGEFSFTYLGCPNFYTRRMKDYYNDLIKKVKGKLHSWKGKLLSFGGKATRITIVLQSMPVNMLSVLDPPNNVIEHLHKIFAISFGAQRRKA
ncbi:uncharacterized protein LOC142171747 [Nicotiana tabacum]|uniref:Uncharacterized protein LOC142171747 n=1 Tax=Nicotiana tabacum TaxID=4097 RepID=A0AC58T2T6_TOBAC